MRNGKPPSRSRGRRALIIFGLAALGTAALGLGGSGNAGAQGASFSAVALASGARLSYSVPGFLVVDTPIDGGGAVAQSVLESSGLSRSFASMPYPGDIAVTAGGTLASFGVAPAGALAYPLHVSADHPGRPEAQTADPSGQFSLVAKASGASSASTARAMAGPSEAPVGGTVADSSVVQAEDGTVTATAMTLSQGIAVADGALTIASIRSRSVTVVRPGTPDTTETETTVQGARVGDTEVTIGPDGVKVAGQPAPLPAGDASRAVNQALSRAGVSVALVEATDVAGGRSASAVEIRSRHPLPLPGDPQGFLVMRFGGATTAILTAEVPGVDLPGSGATPPVDTSPAPPADSAAPTTALDPNPVTGSYEASPPHETPAPPSSPDLAPPTTGHAAAAPGVEANPAPVGPAVATPARSARDLRDETSVIFGVIAFGGALLLAGTLAWGTKGVKVPWTVS